MALPNHIVTTSGGFGCYISNSMAPGLHYEGYSQIKRSGQVSMPTDTELRRRFLPGEAEIHPDEDEHFESLRRKEPFFFARHLVDTPAKTNYQGGMFLGYSGNNNEVWAHLIRAGGGVGYLCDAPGRAYLLLELVIDSRSDEDVGVVIVCGVESLGEVVQWDEGVQGNSLVSRYCFVYDALLDEEYGDNQD